MQAHASIPIAEHRFQFGYYRQVWWGWLIGSAFFFGEVGAGLFLVSLWTGDLIGMTLGYAIVMVGKNGAHLLYLGRPARFWRAARRPDRSWIARGIWATGIFGASGFLWLLSQWGDHRLWTDGPATIIFWMAALSALFIMFYDGFVMSASPSIPFWHIGLLPLLCLTYAALGGVTLSLTVGELLGRADATHQSALMWGESLLLVINLLLLAVYLWLMWHRNETARETVRLLLQGRYARFFVGLVVLVGLIATLLLSLAHTQLAVRWLMIVIAACELTGDFTLLMVLLKSGLYAPQAAPVFLPSRNRRHF